MIAGVCRLLATVIGWLLLVVVAVAGIGAAVFSIQSGSATLGYAKAAELLDLPAFRDTVGAWLDRLAADGDVVSGLAGIGAVVLGLVLLTGALRRGRERLLVVNRAEGGTVAVRRKAAGRALATLAGRPREVTGTRTKLKTRRRQVGGRARVRVDRGAAADGPTVVAEARAAAAPLADALSVSLEVDDRAPRRRRAEVR